MLILSIILYENVLVNQGVLKLNHIPTIAQVANVFMKGLRLVKFILLKDKLNLCTNAHLARGVQED